MFTLKIETGNAAMCELKHVTAAIRKCADTVDENGSGSGTIRDENGNTCGEWSLDWLNSGGPSPEARHVEELEKLGFEGNFSELHEIEARAHKYAEDACNGDVSETEDARRDAEIEAEVAELFGGETPAGFFINGDPRGYALKLRDGTGSLTYRDWGGFEILAPDFEPDEPDDEGHSEALDWLAKIEGANAEDARPGGPLYRWAEELRDCLTG